MGFIETAARLFRYSPSTGFAEALSLASDFGSTLAAAPVVGPAAVAVSGVSVPQALKVPPVSRGVALYLTAAAKLRWTAEDGAPLPAWLTSTPGAVTAEHRIAHTVRDLIFHGRACWWLQRDGAGTITGALLLPPTLWGVDWLGQITLGGQPAPDQTQFAYFASLLGTGFLDYGSDSVTHYLGLSKAILSRSRNPIPVVELKVTDNTGVLEPDEVIQAQKDWSTARQAENGAVAVTPYGLDAIVHGSDADTSMLSEARNAVRLDVANFLNLNAALLDGNSGTSDTYSNTLQNRDEFVYLSLSEFVDPIASRLSQPDILGRRIVPDLSGFEAGPSPAGTATQRSTNP